jgi:hypothetical protein
VTREIEVNHHGSPDNRNLDLVGRLHFGKIDGGPPGSQRRLLPVVHDDLDVFGINDLLYFYGVGAVCNCRWADGRCAGNGRTEQPQGDDKQSKRTFQERTPNG